MKSSNGPKKNDEEEDCSTDFKPFKMYRRIINESLDVELGREVGVSFDYSDLYRELRDPAPYTTEVNLYLANNGGYVEGGLPLYYAFKRCKLPVHVHLRHGCYSMGAILALCGDSLTFEEGSILMFHNYSGGSVGKGQELVDAVAHFHADWVTLSYSLLTPFLTEKEVTEILHDKDKYIKWHDKDLPQRVKRHFGKGK